MEKAEGSDGRLNPERIEAFDLEIRSLETGLVELMLGRATPSLKRAEELAAELAALSPSFKGKYLPGWTSQQLAILGTVSNVAFGLECMVSAAAQGAERFHGKYGAEPLRTIPWLEAKRSFLKLTLLLEHIEGLHALGEKGAPIQSAPVGIEAEHSSKGFPKVGQLETGCPLPLVVHGFEIVKQPAGSAVDGRPFNICFSTVGLFKQVTQGANRQARVVHLGSGDR